MKKKAEKEKAEKEKAEKEKSLAEKSEKEDALKLPEEGKISRFKKKELRPSLAHNQFYFSEESRQTFTDKKPVIVSRLVQRGYTRLEAENLVSGSTSPEELVLALMQNEGMDYGEATEYSSV